MPMRSAALPNIYPRRLRRSRGCLRTDPPFVAAAGSLMFISCLAGPSPEKARCRLSPRRSATCVAQAGTGKADTGSAVSAEVRRCSRGDHPLCLGCVVACRRHGEDEPALAYGDRVDQQLLLGDRNATAWHSRCHRYVRRDVSGSAGEVQGASASRRPVWYASTTAWTRSRRPSFCRMCVTCVLTVVSLI